MPADVEAAKAAYINQWQHCPDKRLHAQNYEITCECGQAWPWQATLGEAMEWLELMEEVAKIAPAVALLATVQTRLF